MSQPRPIRAVFGLAVLALLMASLVLIIAPGQSDQLPVPTSTIQPTLPAFASGRPVQTLYQIEAIAAQSGWTGDLALKAGSEWQSLGDLSRAVSFWELAFRAQPNNLGLVKQLAQADLDLQRWSAATIALSQTIALSPDDEWANYNLGLLQAATSPSAAYEHLRQAAHDPAYRDVASDFLFLSDAKPDDPSNAMKAGMTLVSHHLWNYAESAFDYAAALADPYPEALAYAGFSRDNQGKDGSAQLQQALKLAPANPQVYYLQGLHLRMAGDNNGSLSALLQAANLSPLNPAYAAELGSAYQLVDNLAQAQYWLEQAVKLSGGDQRFQDLLTHFYNQFPSVGS